MATFEQWNLDGLVLGGDPAGTLVVEQFSDPPPKQRAEWISAADSEGAALLRTPQHENREITMRIRVGQQASMNAALDQVGTLIDKLAKADNTQDGITLQWAPTNSTRTWIADVLAGEITDLPKSWTGDDAGWFMNRPVMSVSMTCKPYYRAATEVTTSTASSSTPFVTLQISSVPGDVPALGRLIVTDTATQTRRHVEWGLESQYYNAATSLLIDSDSMTVTGFSGVQTTRTGAYDPNATGSNVVRASLVTNQATAIVGTGALSHVGLFRVKARVFATTTDARVGFVYQDGNRPPISSTAGYVGPIVANAWCEIDLGLIQITPATQGAQQWSGTVMGYVTNMAAGVGTVDVDYLILVPAREGYGKARAANPYIPGALLYFDDFTSTTAGTTLNLKTPPVGSTAWATAGSTSGDYTVVDGPTTGEETVSRNTVSDAGGARFGLLSNSIIEQDVSALTFWSVPAQGIYQGLVARYVDVSNYLMYRISRTSGPQGVLLQPELIVVVAGVSTVLSFAQLGALTPQWLKLRLTVRADGATLGTLMTLNGAVLSYQSGSHASLATGGALATGRAGIYDYNTTPSAQTRYYDTVSVATPAADLRVIHPGRTMEVQSDETIMQDSGGTIYGPVPYYRGSRFLVPTGTSRVLAKARRVDVDINADDAPVTDATQIQVAYTPRSIAIPRT